MISLILILAFWSLIVWVLITYVVKVEPFRTIVIAVAAIVAIIYVMGAFGVADIPLPRLR